MKNPISAENSSAARLTCVDRHTGHPILAQTTCGTGETFAGQQPVRVLHCVGHLSRGGIEKWLYQTLPPQLCLQCEHHVLVRTAKEEAFTVQFREAGIPVLACTNFKNPIRYARDFQRLVKKNGPYDILHVHGSSFSGLLTLALAKFAGIPCRIVHSHNDVRPLLKNRGLLYRTYVFSRLKAYRALADFGFAVSVRAAESMFGSKWETDGRYELMYCGVDCRPFDLPPDVALRARLGIASDAYVIGHVGRFHEQKNHVFLLEIVQAAIAARPSTHCLLIGDGPLRKEIAAEIARRGLQTHFTFVPDTTEPADYMIGAMDCFILPSKYEGLPLAVVEAQAAGLPCLVSDRFTAEAIVDESLVQVLPLERTAAEWAQAALSIGIRKKASPNSVRNLVRESRFNLDYCIATLRARYFHFAFGPQRERQGATAQPASRRAAL